MLLIYCPYCGETREEQEFSYAGEALIERPGLEVTDEEWGDYLFKRKNIKGVTTEQWAHSAGCRKLFVVERNNISNEILNARTFESIWGEQEA